MTSGEADALVVIFTPVGLADTAAVMAAVAGGVTAAQAAGAGLPVLACVLGQDGHRTHLELASERVPCYPFPETPARVLGKAAAYAGWRAAPEGVFPDLPGLDLPAARDVCRRAAAHGPAWLSAEDTGVVLAAAGLPLVPAAFARTPEAAAEAAGRLGFPVAVKLASREFVHKTDVGGVRLGLADADAVRRAFAEVRERVNRAGRPDGTDGVVVQRMVVGGVEVMA